MSKSSRHIPRGRRAPQVARRVLFALVLAGVVPFALAQSPATTDSLLQACREARTAADDAALQRCEQAADAASRRGDAESAFEALMHGAQIATQHSDFVRAEAALAAAERLLPRVADPLAKHRLLRRRGLLAFQAARPAAALAHFLESLAAATTAADRNAVAVSHNDLGVVYRQLGDLPSALAHYQLSLEAKVTLSEADQAATLANIGSLYRQIGDFEPAERFLQRALRAQQDAGQSVPAARTTEELGWLAHARGDFPAADRYLGQAAAAYLGPALGRERMRLALQRAELLLDAGSPTEAAPWLARAREEATAMGRDHVLRAEILDARQALQAGAARGTLRSRADALADALAHEASSDPVLAAKAERVLAELHERVGDDRAALAHLRRFIERDGTLSETRHGERLDALRVRFDLATLERERDHLALEQAEQEAEILAVRSQRAGIVVLAVVLLAAFGAWFQRRLWRQRWTSERQRSLLQQRIDQIRAASAALRADLRSMAWLLDQQAQLAVIFDAGGTVRALTSGAAARLGVAREAAVARPLGALVGEAVAQWAQAQVDAASAVDVDGASAVTDAPAEAVYPEPVAGARLQCRRLALEEELGVLQWDAPTPSAVAERPRTTSASNDSASTSVAAGDVSGDAQPSIGFRPALVALMQLSLDTWERVALKNRIELAERSGIWRITIDEGRLRVRAMDRYLGLDTLPERPRWREVLRTAFFVLAELPLSEVQRARLEEAIAQVQAAAGRREA